MAALLPTMPGHRERLVDVGLQRSGPAFLLLLPQHLVDQHDQLVMVERLGDVVGRAAFIASTAEVTVA
jgi:hypothetical protein